MWSKNVLSVQLFKLVGANDVEAWARRLGMTTPIIADQARALGAFCTRIETIVLLKRLFERWRTLPGCNSAILAILIASAERAGAGFATVCGC